MLRQSRTAGTFEMRFESTSITPLTAVAPPHAELPGARATAWASIHATAPVCSNPRITTNKDAKNNSSPHSMRSIA